MPMQKVEFQFPDPDAVDETDIEIEDSSMLELGEEAEEPEAKKPEPETPESPETTDNELDIEVVDDTPEEDRNRTPGDPPEDVTDEELGQYSKKVRDRIKKFSRGYHDERRAKEEALRERQELEAFARRVQEENDRLKQNLGQNRSTMLEHAKKTVDRDLEQARKDFQEAHEAGNSEALTDAQERMSLAQVRREQLRSMESEGPDAGQPETDAVQQEQQAPQPPQPQRRQADPRAEAWAKENTWFGSDDEMTALALGYHTKLVNSGVDPSSDEYYERLNSRMRQVFPDEFGDPEQPTQEPKRKQSVVAPAQRSTGPKKVRLTQTQVAIAKRLGIPVEEYARQVAELMREENG